MVVAGCLLLLVAADAQAVKWRFKPRITVSETYSSNINLQPDETSEHDFVTDISPGLSLRGESRRLFLDVFYNFQYLNYARNTSSDRINHQLRLAGTGELLEDLFFLDLRGTIRQENINSRGTLADSTISVTDNTTDVYTFAISPYFKHRFGSFMDGEARFTYDKVVRSSLNNDSEGGSVFIEGVSGSQFQRLPWNIYYSLIEQRPERTGNSRFQRVDSTFRYRFTRKYALIFGGGYEDNRLTFPQRSTSDVTWKVGLSLTPTPRTVLEGGVEDRFFGLAPYVKINHRSRHTVLFVNYNEDVTTTDRLTVDRDFIPLTDAFGDPILDPDTGEITQIPIDTPSQINQVLVRRHFDGGVAVKGLRTTAELKVFNDNRLFEISPDEDVYGVIATANRNLSRATNARVWGRWTRLEYEDITPNRDRWEIGTGLNRNFSRDFSGGIDARYIIQDSQDPNQKYDEVRVTLRLNKYF
jgi:uncharacterized protein (PEP-CTERM system associated)